MKKKNTENFQITISQIFIFLDFKSEHLFDTYFLFQ